jgi:group I intron endonuclease
MNHIKNYYIYKITNIKNGKIYIGQTIDPNKRWSVHKKHAENPKETNQYIHYSMHKHGIEHFTFEIIDFAFNKWQAGCIEWCLIDQYNTREPKIGYNIKPGTVYAGHDKRTRQKLSEATVKQIAENGHPAKGTKRTPQQRVKLSLIQQNRNTVYTAEMRQKLSEAHIGYKDTEEAHQNKAKAVKKVWEQRIARLTESGELKCNAPNCEVRGSSAYIILDGIRYCSVHGQRLRRTGFLELQPCAPHNKGKTISEDTRKKLLGRVPHNKTKFSDEQIAEILADTRSIRKIAKSFGVTQKVIKRIKTR